MQGISDTNWWLKANSAFEYGKFLSMLKNHDAMLRSATFHQSVTGGF